MEPLPPPHEKPRRRSIAEDEFRPLLIGQAGEFVQLANGILESPPERWTQRQVDHLYRSTSELETFLDFFGCKQNRTFHRTRELVALIRWLSRAMGGLVHLDRGMASTKIPNQGWGSEELQPRVQRAALFLGESICNCTQALREEWVERKLMWQDGALRVDSLVSGHTHVLLAPDLGEQDEAEGPGVSSAARFSGRYLRLFESWAQEATQPCKGLEGLRSFVNRFASEGIARHFEARIHNLESDYDSLVAGTSQEAENGDLLLLRGSTSLSLLLSESVTALSHLYERHAGPGASPHERDLFGSCIDEEQLLSIIANDGVVLIWETLRTGEKMAQGLVDKLTERASATLELPTGLTLHARPLALVAQVVAHFGTPVEMEMEGSRTNAGSIMQLLVLAGSKPDCREVTFHGDRQVLKDLSRLFQAGLGESGMDRIPPELSYLL